MGYDCMLSFMFYIDWLLKKYMNISSIFLFFKVDFNKYTIIQLPMGHSEDDAVHKIPHNQLKISVPV